MGRLQHDTARRLLAQIEKRHADPRSMTRGNGGLAVATAAIHVAGLIPDDERIALAERIEMWEAEAHGECWHSHDGDCDTDACAPTHDAELLRLALADC